MKNRTLHAARVAAAAVLLPLFAVAPARADVGVVSIRLNLEGCPTWANQLNLWLTRLDGVAGTKLRVGRETRIEVLPRAGVWLAPPLLVKQIARAGFEAFRGDVLVQATGRVAREGGVARLTVDQPGGAPLVFLLSGADPAPGRGEALPDGAAVEVLGLWQPGAGSGPATLVAKKVRLLKPAPR